MKLWHSSFKISILFIVHQIRTESINVFEDIVAFSNCNFSLDKNFTKAQSWFMVYFTSFTDQGKYARITKLAVKEFPDYNEYELSFDHLQIGLIEFERISKNFVSDSIRDLITRTSQNDCIYDIYMLKSMYEVVHKQIRHDPNLYISTLNENKELVFYIHFLAESKSASFYTINLIFELAETEPEVGGQERFRLKKVNIDRLGGASFMLRYDNYFSRVFEANSIRQFIRLDLPMPYELDKANDIPEINIPSRDSIIVKQEDNSDIDSRWSVISIKEQVDKENRRMEVFRKLKKLKRSRELKKQGNINKHKKINL